MNYYVFTKKESYIEGTSKKFNHYWSNDGENYPDYEDFEKFLTDNYVDYEWVEQLAIRLTREDINTLSVNVTKDTYKDFKNLFIKLVDGDETPLYYSNSTIKQVSNQNYQEISYQMIFELDFWATFALKAHNYMKEFQEPLYFMRKMANRYIFDYADTGLTLNYLQQPYLMETGNFHYNLLKDNTEVEMTLATWLYLNYEPKRNETTLTYQEWITKIWEPWSLKQWFGAFDPQTMEMDKLGNYLTTTPITQEWQMVYGIKTWLLQDDVIVDRWKVNDSNWNSNGLYRWLVLKVGNNLSKSSASTVFTNKNSKIHRIGTETKLIDYNSWIWYNSWENYDHSVYGENNVRYNLNYWKWYPYSKGRTFDDIRNATGVFCTNFKLYGDGEYFRIGLRIKEINRDYIMHWNPRTSNGHDIGLGYGIPFKVDNNGKDNSAFINSLWKDTKKPILDYPYDISSLFRSWNGWTWESWCFTEGGWETIVGDNPIDWRFELVFRQNTWEIRVYVSGITFWTIFGAKKEWVRLEYQGDLQFSFDLLTEKTPNENVIEIEDFRKHSFTGEEIMLIPVLKDTIKYDLTTEIVAPQVTTTPTLLWLNNAKGVTPGSSSIIGSPINDIPPFVLAMAGRKPSNGNMEASVNQMMSAEVSKDTTLPICPLNMTGLLLAGDVAETKTPNNYVMPVIFSNMGAIPITIARSPIDIGSPIMGGNNFFNKFYSILTDPFYTTKNRIECEPFMYSPAFYQWMYRIDGSNSITLTADMINFKNMVDEKWRVDLRTFIGDRTFYLLDLNNLRNLDYPFTDNYIELGASDNRVYPYSSEQYYNWLQNNEVSQETSKNTLDINKYYAPIEAGIAGAASGAAAGAGAGWGPLSAMVGGLIGAGAGALAGVEGAKVAARRNTEIWENEWKGRFQNMYRAPASFNQGGFATGSILYSTYGISDEFQYNLFRTYKIPTLFAEEIWNEVAMKGYFYKSSLLYKEYDNRLIFNYFQVDTRSKEFLIDNHLKNKLMEESLLFSQIGWINWYKDKVMNGIRLWKKDYDKEDIKSLIEDNIENEYIPPDYYDVIIELDSKYEWNRSVSGHATPAGEETIPLVNNKLPTDINDIAYENKASYFKYKEKTGVASTKAKKDNIKVIEVSYKDLGVWNKTDFKARIDKIYLDYSGTRFARAAEYIYPGEEKIFGITYDKVYDNKKSIAYGTVGSGDNINFNVSWGINQILVPNYPYILEVTEGIIEDKYSQYRYGIYCVVNANMGNKGLYNYFNKIEANINIDLLETGIKITFTPNQGQYDVYDDYETSLEKDIYKITMRAWYSYTQSNITTEIKYNNLIFTKKQPPEKLK